MFFLGCIILCSVVSTHTKSIFKDPNVTKHLSFLHNKYGIVPADNAPNNAIFVCRSHYIDFLHWNWVFSIPSVTQHIFYDTNERRNTEQ